MAGSRRGERRRAAPPRSACPRRASTTLTWAAVGARRRHPSPRRSVRRGSAFITASFPRAGPRRISDHRAAPPSRRGAAARAPPRPRRARSGRRRRRPSSSRPSTTSSSKLAAGPCDVGGAVVAAGDRLLAEELDRRQGDLDATRREPDDDRGPARSQHVPGLADRRRRRRRPRTRSSTPPPVSARTVRDGIDSWTASTVVGGAAAGRAGSSLSGSTVDGDDRRGAGEPRARDHLQPDTAAADHAHAGADRHAGALDGADPGHRRRSRAAPPATAGTDVGSGTAHRPPGRRRARAKQATINPCWSTAPSSPRSREVPSISVPGDAVGASGLAQGRGAPRGTRRHSPQDGTKQNATWSPGARPATPAPTASTTPAPSWPSTIGQRPSPSRPVGQVKVGVADAGRRDPDEHLVAALGLEQHPLDRNRPTRLAEHAARI